VRLLLRALGRVDLRLQLADALLQLQHFALRV
jgi:hypothetical protein